MRNSQRLFLRSLMSKQFLSEGETKSVYQKACEAFGEVRRMQREKESNRLSPQVSLKRRDDSSPRNFAAFMETINKSLKPFFMEIRHGISEDDGAVYYGLVNTTEDEHSKIATDFSPNDIAFFKKAMDLIVAAPDGTVSAMDVINAAADLEKKMTMTHAEELITRLVHGMWMSESAGAYSLGPRAMLELHPYLKRVYEDDIVHCMMCHEITIKGQCCSQCEGKIHKHCAARYFRGRTQNICPNQRCGAMWIHEIPQLAVPPTPPPPPPPQSYGGSRTSTSAKPSSRHHRRR